MKFSLALITLYSSLSFANPTFLAADQAFQISSESISKQSVELNWKIAPHYYLYHDQFSVKSDQQIIELKLPKGQEKNDPTFGLTEVHYNHVSAQFSVKPDTAYTIQWQGCSQDGLCYPLQHLKIKTDADGLIPQMNANQNQGFAAHQQKNEIKNLTDSTNNLKEAKNASVIENESLQAISSEQDNNQKSTDKNNTMSLQWNDDQGFFNLLSQDTLMINLFIFFGLGILLAFLPCSLPLIPILSTLLIQKKSGLRAAAIASSFVISMALIYALMGVVVAEIGYSFQRWFQNPVVLSIFASLFILFALNLFGLFNLTLPNKFTQKLSDFQNSQKAGSILGAAVMGALSALIIGPCMSAPLAGALLFVSQSHSAVLGGVYLFLLGLGLGLPLFIASVFGSRLLPKPGIWMNHLKVSFGFLMLFMAFYFIQPMLKSTLYLSLNAIIFLALAIYLSLAAIKDSKSFTQKLLFICAIFLATSASIWNVVQAYQSSQTQQLKENHLAWHTVSTLEALNMVLEHAKKANKNVVIDVYADWCVACQPLEKEVLPRVDVQDALKNNYLIKLDLSSYDSSQDLILKKFEILGPPTFLFLNENGNEIRDLRLTGTFKANALLTQLEALAKR
ncbi:MAG: protein-disulfide reductase DsbD [Candidatus Acinetobacter avistercoris]|uniref:protein-disulfide reductase DsbD n=1 Tax=Acinetobacter sp. KS-LM10 TaxID=3120518 RepID=UPI001F986609|nr:protein-disulfide reductase DsbD [Candidatus Acinetobacter avistercoris]